MPTPPAGRSPADLPGPATAARDPADEGGDPACWLSRACPDCGRLDDGPPPDRCPGCGAAMRPG